MSFGKLGLRAELLSAVAAQGYTAPTPIQTQAIPVILEGYDILAGAQTGTGKTAAFALPIVQMLSEDPPAKKKRQPRALVLVPTRELAAQVGKAMQDYGRRLSLRATVIYGGININAQIVRLNRGVDIVVATPGRLLDHANRGTLDLSRVKILVLDEADRMLDMGFIDEILEVTAFLPDKRQTLLFSATYPDSIKRLADELLNNPRQIEAARPNRAADGVTQVVYRVERLRKRELLAHLIKKENWRRVMVFTRTRYGADKLTQQLITDDIVAAAIHSSKSQSLRTRTLADFKRGLVRILVATDVAARGLDIDGLPRVVNFDMPDIPENYVHRIGRTGRAGEKGVAISLVCDQEQALLIEIERLLNHKIPVKRLAGFQPKNDYDPDIIAAKRKLKEKAAQKQKKAIAKSSGKTRKTQKAGKTRKNTKRR
ncbi:MAG: DEAD/DEAH box helicase [Desulfobacteraceae bacterium]|nr:DEAD/DEAH box helicase [Desulfobacteraceae bacterium]MBC2755047.1 DEAD/DEAH box helicase [Desulfobacteraceae bacterium]